MILERVSTVKEAGVFRRLGDFGRYVIGDTYSEANEGLKGRIVKEIAAERGQDAFDTLHRDLHQRRAAHDPVAYAQ